MLIHYIPRCSKTKNEMAFKTCYTDFICFIERHWFHQFYFTHFQLTAVCFSVSSIAIAALWYSSYHYCATLFIKVWIQVLWKFKSCLWPVSDLRKWGSLKMISTGNKTKSFLLIIDSTKTIHHQFIIISDNWC